MQAPGQLDDLDAAGLDAWARRIDNCVTSIVAGLTDGPNPYVVHPPNEFTTAHTTVDWTGLPARPVVCLSRAHALELLDHANPHEQQGRALHEEYVEWRVVRDDTDIQRIEFTTELSDYWRVLAAYQPRRALELVTEFARAPVNPIDLYPGCDPFDSTTTVEQREAAFVEAMLADESPSPYNDGRSAITFMAQRSNTLSALVNLVLIATRPTVTLDASDASVRCVTCDEIIPLLGGAAQSGRQSDPILVERVIRFAYEGRLIAFDDPLGVYIQGFETHRLRTPDGQPITNEWLTLSRGHGPLQPDGIARWQRLTLEPPAGNDTRVSELVDVATEQPIRYGGQVADLVRVAVVFRVSDPDHGPVGPLTPTQPAATPFDEACGCSDLRERWTAYLAERR